MRNKTRKFIWSAPLVAALAIIGALTLAGVLLLPNANNADAQASTPGQLTTINLVAGHMEVIVTWDPPSDIGGQDPTYQVRYAQVDAQPSADDEWTVHPINDDIRRREITGLTNGNAVFVQVRAVNTAGAGPWGPATAPSATPATQPPSDLEVEVMQTGDGKVDISWSVENNGTKVVNYQVAVSPNDGVTIVGAADASALDGAKASVASDAYLAGTVMMTTASGLTAGTPYTFTVTITSSPTATPPSNTATKTLDPAPVAADNPTQVDAVPSAENGHTSLTVSWVKSANNDVDRYQIRYRAVGSGRWTPTDDVMTTSETLTELMPDTEYQVQVRAGNIAGYSAWIAFELDAETDAIGTTEMTPAVASTLDVPDDFDNSGNTSSGSVELTLTIGNLPMDMAAGSSIELYLEDDFDVPNSIDRSDVYFIVTNPTTSATNGGGRVYPTEAVKIDDDDHYGGDDDWSIQVFIPDMNTASVDAAAGFQGPMANQTLTLVITEDAGIKNPSEEGAHSVGYSVLGPNGSANAGAQSDVDGVPKWEVPTYAKIGLSDENNSRGYELTVTGSGFNNGTSAAAYVLNRSPQAAWDETNCLEMLGIMGMAQNIFTEEAAKDSDAGMKYCGFFSKEPMLAAEVQDEVRCRTIIALGSRAGVGNVGSDDKVAVTFEVTVPTFKPGDMNYICVADGEGRLSETDIEQFELEPSISITPTTASVGDTVTIFAQDFPSGDTGAAGKPIQLANQVITTSSGPIDENGAGTVTFEVPGWAEGTLRLDAWGKDTKLTVIGSSLTVSKSDALPNELITLTGDGFSTGSGNYVDGSMVTIDGVPLHVHKDSLNRDGQIDLSNSGQFVATVVLWPAEPEGTNPALTAGVHTIKVVDNKRFSGMVTVSIPEPTISVTPGVAGPRDIITISGENWPVDNIEGAAPPTVQIKVEDGRPREYSALPDSAGRWFVEHRVASTVAIPSTNRVTATIDSDVVKLATFEVPSAIIEVTPTEAQPGDTVSLKVDKMPVYAGVDSVQIAGREALPTGNFSTDRTGSVSVEGVVIPGLDPGVYSILMDINGTVAIGSLEILPEGPIGSETPVAEALSPVGDSLVAVFYFDNISKSWDFYDPREEFAELNTLTSLTQDEAYWVLVSDDVDDVVLNNKSRSLTCSGGNCWTLMNW